MTHRNPPIPGRRRRRPLAAALFAGLLAAAGLVAVPSPAQAAVDVDTGTEYVLQNVHSGLVADVEDGSTETGAELIQWSRTDQPWQRFRFASSGDGYYRIINVNSGQAIDVWEHSTEGGAEIRQYTDLGGDNQQWRVEEAGTGVSLINRNSGLALEAWEWGDSEGDRLSQWDPTGEANQQWRLIPVGDSGGGDPSGECGTGSYDAEVTQSGGTYTAAGGGTVHYSGGDLAEAVRAAIGSLSGGRGSQESVVVRASGDVSAGESIDVPSHTRIEVCGTLNATGSASANNAPIRIRHAQDVSVPYLSVTGAPYFAVWVRTSQNVHLGEIDLRQSGGAGIRIDSRDDDSVREARDITVDHVYVEGTGGHGVETYGVDGIDIGTVVARDTGYSGLLLNDTVNADIGLVDGVGTGTGTGYAAFRMANRNGRVGGSYPTTVHVDEVRARGGGRGIFCVSESGGAVIDRVDIADTGSNAILIENCHNVDIAAEQGSVAGPGNIRLAARSDFANTSDITLQNLTVTDSGITERPCVDGITYRNNTLVNSGNDVC
ncbi:parallel beta-helix repeat-containing ricin B lectin [Streptomonospora alba]|uniref:Parallel beta-helix repeat-containing ricin B lectin n=1 Tax=Streptomonospora alba TaxID=183763 RepID=A0A0C2JC67_9ACTN|nr:RICIN domain-containing protein [Streptomonospora alba]KIH96565.1 parallel beta-helix repeat-containing ricin B lectin [Streptomonospora alba]